MKLVPTCETRTEMLLSRFRYWVKGLDKKGF
jgi:hypothetical protein